MRAEAAHRLSGDPGAGGDEQPPTDLGGQEVDAPPAIGPAIGRGPPAELQRDEHGGEGEHVENLVAEFAGRASDPNAAPPTTCAAASTALATSTATSIRADPVGAS